MSEAFAYYLSVVLIFNFICGAITASMNQKKGYEGGFWWGFFLDILGIIIVAVRPFNNQNNGMINNNYQQNNSGYYPPQNNGMYYNNYPQQNNGYYYQPQNNNMTDNYSSNMDMNYNNYIPNTSQQVGTTGYYPPNNN